jgi:hypothetical protein
MNAAATCDPALIQRRSKSRMIERTSRPKTKRSGPLGSTLAVEMIMSQQKIQNFGFRGKPENGV